MLYILLTALSPLLFPALCAMFIMWSMERRERVHHAANVSPQDCVMAGGIVFTIVLISTIQLYGRQTLMMGLNALYLLLLWIYHRRSEHYYGSFARDKRQQDNKLIVSCQNAIRRDLRDLPARYQLLEIYESRKDYPNAIQVVRTIMDLDPSVQNSWRLKMLQEAQRNVPKTGFLISTKTLWRQLTAKKQRAP